MENFHRKILDAIRSHSLFCAGDTIVVGVSGGADSIALLDVLVSLSLEFPVSLVVAHLNHLLRGDDSDGDEAFVAVVAAGYGLPFFGRRVDVRGAACKSGQSLEEAGRQSRYDFFREVATETGAAAIAVAHHADDQAETLLMRLLRGAGTDGLAAMRMRNDRSVVRPFLGVTRAEIDAYVAERTLSFRNDASNEDCSFLRNRLRHELLPLLASYNPEVVRTLAGTAEILASDAEVLDLVVDGAWGRSCKGSGGSVDFDRTALADELQGVRLRLYRRAIRDVTGNLRRIGRLHLATIDRLFLHGAPGSEVSLPGNVVARCSYSTASLSVSGDVACEVSVEIHGPAEIPLSAGVLRVSKEKLPVGFRSGIEFFDADALPFPWRIRYFRDGDRFVPFGMSVSVKLKDFFINNKVPRHERRRIPLLVDSGDRIIAICGIRRSGLGVITAETSRVVSVEVVRK